MKALSAVVNTSPWIALSLCGQTGLLRHFYDNVFMPQAVKQEIIAGGLTRSGVKEPEDADWLQIKEIKDQAKVLLLHELDQGEAEVIILAQEQKATEVIPDEKIARMEAKLLGLKVVGTLGLLLRARKRGFILELSPLIHKILGEGIYIHPNIVESILNEAGEKAI